MERPTATTARDDEIAARELEKILVHLAIFLQRQGYRRLEKDVNWRVFVHPQEPLLKVRLWIFGPVLEITILWPRGKAATREMVDAVAVLTREWAKHTVGHPVILRLAGLP